MECKVKLPRSTPEEQGIPASAITDFLNGAEQASLELHSVMLVRNGYVVAEGWWDPYHAERPHLLFSLSKSFASSAIGLAEQENLLSVDDLVISFFPEYADLYESNANLLSMRIHHLLSMSTGHAEDTTGRLWENEDWAKTFLSLPVEHEPGTHFVYNSGASYMLSAIIQRVTGRTLFQYLEPRLFEPLGIEGATWETCPKGINVGGWGLSIRTEDIAKFGYLYLKNGIWDGKRILSEDWVKRASSKQVSNGEDPNSDWNQGYGYQFWRSRHGAYRGDGAFGQYCIVMPEQDAVIAITSGLNDMQAVLNLVWEHILPAMGNAPVSADEEGAQSLKMKLDKLAIHPPKKLQSSSIAQEVSDKHYRLTSGDKTMRISFHFSDDLTEIALSDEYGDNVYRCGIESWLEGTATILGKTQPVCASGTWSDDHTFILTLRFVETPFCHTFVCSFEDDNLRVESSANVSFGPEQPPVYEGSVER